MLVVALDWPGRSRCFGFGVGDFAAAVVAVVGSLKEPYPDWIDSDYPLQRDRKSVV